MSGVGVQDWGEEGKESTRVDALQASVWVGAMLVLGAAVIFGVYSMREFRWEMREAKPAGPGDRGVPMGALHLRMHKLRTDETETDALIKSVRTFPPNLLPLPVATDASADALLALLRREGRPVTVVGPGRSLFRVYHSPPLDEEHRGLYGEDLDWSDVRKTARAVEDAVAAAVGTAAPLRTVLYALPEEGPVKGWTWPFPVETESTFAQAYAAAKAAGDGLSLLALHSDLTAPRCP